MNRVDYMEHQEIIYTSEASPTTSEIIEVYRSSGIIRPIEDPERIKRMYENSNLVISAWDNETLVGIARSHTDFSYCCYLSDLAVRGEYQNKGIGQKLIGLTQEKIGKDSTLILRAAPGAMDYYPRLGFKTIENGFYIKRSH